MAMIDTKHVCALFSSPNLPHNVGGTFHSPLKISPRQGRKSHLLFAGAQAHCSQWKDPCPFYFVGQSSEQRCAVQRGAIPTGCPSISQCRGATDTRWRSIVPCYGDCLAPWPSWLSETRGCWNRPEKFPMAQLVCANGHGAAAAALQPGPWFDCYFPPSSQSLFNQALKW